jgi:hypothetical protein
MKITKSVLKQLIKEELEQNLEEVVDDQSSVAPLQAKKDKAIELAMRIRNLSNYVGPQLRQELGAISREVESLA